MSQYYDSMRRIKYAIFGATQRTGSTALQRLVGVNPQSFCWGEGGRILNRLIDIEQAFKGFADVDKEQTEKYYITRNPSLWIANMCPTNPDQMRNALTASGRVLFERLYIDSSPSDVINIGLKDVGIEIAGIRLFSEIFPECKIILISRNPIDTWRSVHYWHGGDVAGFFHMWRNNTLAYYKSGFDFLWYEELRSERTVNFLASAFDITVPKVIEALNLRVGETDQTIKNSVRPDELDYLVENYDIFRLENLINQQPNGNI